MKVNKKTIERVMILEIELHEGDIQALEYESGISKDLAGLPVTRRLREMIVNSLYGKGFEK